MAVPEQRVTIDRRAVGVDEVDLVEQPVECLRLADLGGELWHGLVVLVGLADVLGLLAVLHGHAGVLALEVVGLDLDRLGVGHCAQRKIDLDRLDGGAAHRLDEVVGSLAGGCEPLAEVDALGLELLDSALDTLVEVGVDHGVGNFDLDELGEGLVHRPNHALAGFVELLLGLRLAQALVPLVDGVELSEVLRHPVVGEFGSDRGLDGGDLDHEVGFFLEALRGRGECDLVTDGGAGQMLVEVLGDPALAELVGEVLGVEPQQFLAVAGGGEVDGEEVSSLRRTICVDQARCALQFCLMGLGEIVVGDLERRQLDTEFAVALHRDRRADLAGGIEFDRARTRCRR